MKKLWIAVALTLGIIAAPVARSACAAGDEAGQVMAAERARIAALDASDVAALESIMADDVTYVHASGKVDTKAAYLAAIRSGELHSISWVPKDLHVRLLGNDAALANGQSTVRVTDARVQPGPFDISICVLSV